MQDEIVVVAALDLPGGEGGGEGAGGVVPGGGRGEACGWSVLGCMYGFKDRRA